MKSTKNMLFCIQRVLYCSSRVFNSRTPRIQHPRSVSGPSWRPWSATPTTRACRRHAAPCWRCWRGMFRTSCVGMARCVPARSLVYRKGSRTRKIRLRQSLSLRLRLRLVLSPRLRLPLADGSQCCLLSSAPLLQIRSGLWQQTVSLLVAAVHRHAHRSSRLHAESAGVLRVISQNARARPQQLELRALGAIGALEVATSRVRGWPKQ